MKNMAKAVIAVVMLAGFAAAETNWGVDVFKGYKAPQTKASGGIKAERLGVLAKALDNGIRKLPGDCFILAFAQDYNTEIPALGLAVAKSDTEILRVSILDAVGVKTLPDGGKSYVNSSTNGVDIAWSFNMTADKDGNVTMIKLGVKRFRQNSYPKPATILEDRTLTCK